MSVYVHIQVSFACDDNEPVARLAKEHLASSGASFHTNEARWFLEALASRTGRNEGPKGGLSLWGMVGNHTEADRFVQDLSAFWLALFKAETWDGEEMASVGPLDFEHVVVFAEREQSGAASAWQIRCVEGSDTLDIQHFECLPFCWNQH